MVFAEESVQFKPILTIHISIAHLLIGYAFNHVTMY